MKDVYDSIVNYWSYLLLSSNDNTAIDIYKNYIRQKYGNETFNELQSEVFENIISKVCTEKQNDKEENQDQETDCYLYE